jgi:hypothetical protein
MTDPAPPPPSAPSRVDRPPGGTLEKTVRPPPGGASARTASFGGRARSFRQEQTRRRSARRDRVADVVMVAAIVVGAYFIVTERPYSPSSGVQTGFPGSGARIVVQFGTPTVSTLTCGGGGVAYVERIPWVNSTQLLTTGEVYVRVYEIWDGDNIADPGAVANVTPSNLCEGTPPSSGALWYAVLAAPNGTNVLTFTEAHTWTSVTNGSTNLVIASDSDLVIVTYESFAGTGRGLSVVGFAEGSQITGTLPL